MFKSLEAWSLYKGDRSMIMLVEMAALPLCSRMIGTMTGNWRLEGLFHGLGIYSAFELQLIEVTACRKASGHHSCQLT